MTVEIRKVKYLPELRRVAELADAIWHECFVDIISEGQIDYMIEKFQSLYAMCRQIEEQSYTYLFPAERASLKTRSSMSEAIPCPRLSLLR